jgi:hypothetical protein
MYYYENHNRDFRFFAETGPQARATRGCDAASLVERGLNRVVSETRVATPFKLRSAALGGDSLQTAFRDAPWVGVRDEIYKGGGG